MVAGCRSAGEPGKIRKEKCGWIRDDELIVGMLRSGGKLQESAGNVPEAARILTKMGEVV